MIGLLIFGFYQSKKNKSLDDFILTGNNTSWITSMFSIVATETSVLTFISVPGISYRGDWTFLQLALGYIFGRILVSLFLLPIFFKKGVSSIYEVLQESFGATVQKLASFTFLITRLLADSVRFLATAIILQSITGWSIAYSVILIASVTLFYTLLGGLRAVIKVDAFQFIIYLISGFICIFYLYQNIDITFTESIHLLHTSNKINIFDFSGSFLNNPFMFFSAFIGGTMLSFASHGADYMMVQRVLATKNLSSAKKAMIGSGFFVFLQFSIFLFIGSLIYLVGDCNYIGKDKEITYVLDTFIPIGFKGIVIAGILSAAMSTLSSSINSLSSTTVKDWFPSINKLKYIRIVSFLWAIMLVLMSFLFNESNSALVIIGLKIASYTYGCLLSFFILTRINISFSLNSIFLGYFSSILSVFYLIEYQIAWTFYILFSVIVFTGLSILIEKTTSYPFFKDCLIVAIIFSLFSFIPIKGEKTKYSKIIDLKIKQDCIDHQIFLGSDIIKEYPDVLSNLENVGLVINQTSGLVRLDNENMIIQTDLKNINIKAIFTPEHGFTGKNEAGKVINDVYDYDVPIISLYGEKRKPNKKEMLNLELDAVIFDIQDIGSRYYTYVSTMTYMMEACAENNIPFYVLDRPNPLGGHITGPKLKEIYSSFVGMHQIPIRHGMTIGELAYKINENGWLNSGKKVELYIVKMQGWTREMFFDDTGLEWIPPSPNIPDFETSLLYTGTCLIEGTNISEGRGTDTPFKIFGSPWLNSKKIINYLESKNFEGVEFKSISFKPKSINGKSINPKYENMICEGVEIVVLNKEKIRPLEIILHSLQFIHQNHPEFEFISNNFIDKLYGDDQLRLSILNNIDVENIIDEWKKLNESNVDKSNFLIY